MQVQTELVVVGGLAFTASSSVWKAENADNVTSKSTVLAVELSLFSFSSDNISALFSTSSNSLSPVLIHLNVQKKVRVAMDQDWPWEMCRFLRSKYCYSVFSQLIFEVKPVFENVRTMTFTVIEEMMFWNVTFDNCSMIVVLLNNSYLIWANIF